MIRVSRYRALPFPLKTALSFLGFRGRAADAETLSRLERVRAACEAQLLPAVCYLEGEVSLRAGSVRFASLSAESADLARNLKGCRRAVLFAATIGPGPDRLLARYAVADPLDAALLQAAGAAYAESLCDVFCAELSERYAPAHLRPRFSPGYGDLALGVQKQVFSLLFPQRIGLTLNDSLLMSPTKSVTAFVGIGETPGAAASRCAVCGKDGCEYQTTEEC